MATGRVTTLNGWAKDSTGRVTRLRAAAANDGAVGRVTRLRAVVALLTTGRVTALRAAAVQAATITIPTRTGLEPGVPVTVTAAVSAGTATGWSWSCDQPVEFTSNGASLTYTPPGTLSGTTLTWTATATVGGQDTSGSAAHAVLPHAGWWILNRGGGLVALYPT